MRIFISYANERRKIADKIALGLRNHGHEVFFDRDDLPEGEAYNQRIHNELQRSDLLVFLISPESVAKNRYTLTELRFARQRWKSPSNRVLPVMVEATPYSDLPAYLTAVSVLEPVGNLVAETLEAVEQLHQRLRRKRLRTLLGVALMLAASLGLAILGLRLLQSESTVPVGPLGADTVISGKVRNPLKGSGVAGAELKIEHNAQVLSHGRSKTDGRFQLSFVFPATPADGTVTLIVEHEDFISTDKNLSITRGLPEDSFYEVDLMPSALGDCLIDRDHLVIVGHFLPPAGASTQDAANLSDRVSRALENRLLPSLQRQNLSSDVQPIIIPCSGAKPGSPVFASSYAEALSADAFISGDVRRTDQAYDVTTVLGDRFALFSPTRHTNASVDLDNLTQAELDGTTRATILVVLARGYHEKGLHDVCIDVIRAAQQVSGELTPEMAETLAACKEDSAVSGLLRGGQR